MQLRLLIDYVSPLLLTCLLLGLLLLDYAYWWWHRANHLIPFLWRFHNMHHTDLDLDVNTAARFHFGEMVFSVGFLSLAVVTFGVRPGTFVVFFITLEAATLFHHSNWRLPLGLERALNQVVVTPRMHGLHHSIVRRETDSNWGTIFCWWDKLHHTLRRDVPQDEITVGVAASIDVVLTDSHVQVSGGLLRNHTSTGDCSMPGFTMTRESEF